MKALQMRIHMLRGAMSREKHPQYAIATRVHTSCQWDFEAHPSTKKKQFPKDATGCKLVLYPKDSQFADILEAAGVTVENTTSDLLTEAAPLDVPLDPTIESAKPETTSDDSAPTDIYERFK
jgi:hypothetical protein